MGIEPMRAGTTNQCVNHFTNTAIMYKTGIEGVEPPLMVLETIVLPLNYIPIVLQNHSSITAHPMALDGIEPPTHGASIHCSTN